MQVTVIAPQARCNQCISRPWILL